MTITIYSPEEFCDQDYKPYVQIRADTLPWSIIDDRPSHAHSYNERINDDSQRKENHESCEVTMHKMTTATFKVM